MTLTPACLVGEAPNALLRNARFNFFGQSRFAQVISQEWLPGLVSNRARRLDHHQVLAF
jgi:hypothetical protein